MEEDFHIEYLSDDEPLLFGDGTDEPTDQPTDTPATTLKPYLLFSNFTGVSSGFTNQSNTAITDSRSFTGTTGGGNSFQIQYKDSGGTWQNVTLTTSNNAHFAGSPDPTDRIDGPLNNSTYRVILDQNISGAQSTSVLSLYWEDDDDTYQTEHYIYQPPEERYLRFANSAITAQSASTSLTISVESTFEWKLSEVETDTPADNIWFQLRSGSTILSPTSTDTPTTTPPA